MSKKARKMAKLDSGEILVHPFENVKGENGKFLGADTIQYFLSYLTHIGDKNCGLKHR